MSRIDTMFRVLAARRETALLPYLTVGYPARGATAPLALDLVRAGADGLELGLPFSDPLADGATLQRACQRALEAGFRLDDAFEAARRIRAETDVPLVFMSYYNPVQHRGLDRFAGEAAAAGVDGLIVPDLPPEEAGLLRAACHRVGLVLITMLAPTTPEERMAAACAEAEGFIYCVSLVGVTGARASLSEDLPTFLARVRRHTALPLVVGFGISRPEHVATVGRYAEGAIVASALADLLERLPKAEHSRAAAEFVRSLKAACPRDVSVGAGPRPD